jgi:hypothetical protein
MDNKVNNDDEGDENTTIEKHHQTWRDQRENIKENQIIRVNSERHDATYDDINPFQPATRR